MKPTNNSVSQATTLT